MSTKPLAALLATESHLSKRHHKNKIYVSIVSEVRWILHCSKSFKYLNIFLSFSVGSLTSDLSIFLSEEVDKTEISEFIK